MMPNSTTTVNGLIKLCSRHNGSSSKLAPQNPVKPALQAKIRVFPATPSLSRIEVPQRLIILFSRSSRRGQLSRPTGPPAAAPLCWTLVMPQLLDSQSGLCLPALAYTGSTPVAGIATHQGRTRQMSEPTEEDEVTQPTPQQLQERFESCIEWVESLETDVETAQTRNQELRNEIDRLDEENRQLRARINELEANTSLLEKAKQDGLSSPEERAVAVIQKIKQKADRLDTDRVVLKHEDAWSAVNYSVHRTSVYDIFRTAESLIGRPDVLWYQSESQASEKDSRLVLDRRDEALPAEVAGHSLTDRGRSTTEDQADGTKNNPETTDHVNAD